MNIIGLYVSAGASPIRATTTAFAPAHTADALIATFAAAVVVAFPPTHALVAAIVTVAAAAAVPLVPVATADAATRTVAFADTVAFVPTHTALADIPAGGVLVSVRSAFVQHALQMISSVVVGLASGSPSSNVRVSYCQIASQICWIVGAGMSGRQCSVG